MDVKSPFIFTHSKQRTPEFESDKNKLYTVAFINENKKINPLAFKAFNIISIDDEDDLEKKY
nr:hypothetical protein [uncultured Flavobacterium sp.]